MDFTRSEESQSIQELAAQIFADQSGDEALKRFDRHEIAYHAELWKLLAEAGLIGVALAEEFGGSGLGFTELCAVFEEQGRHVAAGPGRDGQPALPRNTMTARSTSSSRRASRVPTR